MHLRKEGIEELVLDKILQELIITFIQAEQPLGIATLQEAYENMVE